MLLNRTARLKQKAARDRGGPEGTSGGSKHKGLPQTTRRRMDLKFIHRPLGLSAQAPYELDTTKPHGPKPTHRLDMGTLRQKIGISGNGMDQALKKR